MPKVRFGDVVREVKHNIDRNNNPYESYVAGDHMDTADLTIHRRGCFATDDVGPAFVREFKKGQVLYGSRRTYLKKVAVADFDGVTANTTFVLETKNPDIFLQTLLPFVMLTDSFTEWSVKRSKGSTNPYVLFSDLADFEFELPDIEEQRRVSDVLWACFRLREHYEGLIQQCDALVQSQFVEMFGDVITNSQNWPMRPLAAIAETRLGKMVDAKKQTGEHRHPYIANFNVQWFRFDFSELREMDFLPEDQQEFELQEGDLLVCEGGEVGRCAIWHNEIEGCYFQKAVHRIRCNKQYLVPGYLAYWFKHHSDFNQFEDIVGGKTSIAHLPGVKLKALQIPLPPIERQQSFCALCDQTDKSKYCLQRAQASQMKTARR